MGKYFKYAIGEIILVVIGILIALSINNWNTNRLNQKKEVSILHELGSEYDGKLDELNQKVELRNFMITNSGILLNMINNENYNISHDSLVSLVAMTILTPTYDASNSVTDELLNSGNLYILKNKKLRQLLLDWESQLDKLVEEEQVVVKILVELYIPYLSKRVPYQDIGQYFLKRNTEVLQFIMKNTDNADHVISNSLRKTNVKSLFEDIEFESYLATINFSSIISNMQSENLRSHIQNVQDLINEELKDK